MSGKKLFGFKDRHQSHLKLEEVLARGRHPRACCREDPNDPDEPYQVWTDNASPNQGPAPEPTPAPLAGLPPGMAKEIAQMVADILTGKGPQ